ncbi:DUF998 domain-containing protein [Streptomyces sp. NPDC060194]|uniref:DUF998 domain-containing protein n=1 Tax=Streptomyces sp. NPDC060194 TaxID=3347069 RepID=UPI0036580FC9
MTQTLSSAAVPTPAAPNAVPPVAPSRRTRLLLAAGIAAGPVFLVSGLVQASVRDGFDITRHALSQLSLGDAGWVQTGTFLLAGVLALLGAAGLRRAEVSRWVPLLVAVFGAGFVLSGIFEADPGRGFPVGTPDTPEVTMSTEGGLHMAAAMLAFVSLSASFLVLGRHFAARGERGRAIVCRVAPLVVLGGSAASAASVLTFLVGAAFGMLWLSAITARILRTAVR